MKKIRVLFSLRTTLITFALPAAAQSKVEKYQKACDSGNMTGCYNLGMMYYKGKDIKQDYPLAAQLFTKACDSGYMDGCSYLGVKPRNLPVWILTKQLR